MPSVVKFAAFLSAESRHATCTYRDLLMKRWRSAAVAFGLGLSLSVVACGPSAEPLSESVQNATGTGGVWENVLDCGGAVIDVDSGERRNLQLVVRDAAAFPVLDRTITYHQIDTGTERIYRGQSPYGVWNVSQFRHFRAYETVRNSAGMMPGIEVIREGAGVRVRQLDLGKTGCQPYSLDVSPPDDAYPAECEVANYVFPQCRKP